MVTYSRMEAKLIHGQTTTVLRNRYKCDGIILVDDMVAKDGGMRAIFSAAAPPGVKVYFFNTEKALIQLKKAADSELNYFVIFRGPLEENRSGGLCLFLPCGVRTTVYQEQHRGCHARGRVDRGRVRGLGFSGGTGSSSAL